MRRFIPYLSLALALGPLACATQRPLRYPAERVELGRFTFLPPNEPGWDRITDEPGRWVALRSGESHDETWVLKAELMGAPAFKSDEDCLAQTRQMVEADVNRTSSRYEAKSFEVDLWPKLGVRCARAQRSATDTKPARESGGDAPMHLRLVTFYCAHPRNPEKAISLELSQRSDAGAEDPELVRKAEAIASTLEFRDGFW